MAKSVKEAWDQYNAKVLNGQGTDGEQQAFFIGALEAGQLISEGTDRLELCLHVVSELQGFEKAMDASRKAEEEIGIPNVPALVWEAEQKQAEERLAAGLCPKHNTPLKDDELYNYCPACEEER